MENELVAVGIGAVAAVGGGLVTGAYEHARDYLSRPRLVLDYPNPDRGPVESNYRTGEREVSALFIRVRVRNIGRRVARGVRIYLVGVEEVQQSAVTQTAYKDSRPLTWAGYPSDFAPRDIPRGIDAYVNVVSVVKHEPGWRFHVQQLFASEETLKSRPGTYRLTLLATGDEVEPYHFAIEAYYTNDWQQFRAYLPC